MANFVESPVLSDRYFSALQFFAEAHRFQVRKDGTPYFAHLQAVASLVLELGGSEDEAIAALGHDFPEDIYSNNPEEGLQIIEEKFGAEVAAIVRGCTELDKSADWKQRKLVYIEQVKNGSESIKIVSFADKFHNLQAYLIGAKFGRKDESQKNVDRTFWFLNEVYKQAFSDSRRLFLSSALNRYKQALKSLKEEWGLVSEREKLEKALAEANQLRSSLYNIGESLVAAQLEAIAGFKRQQVGEIEAVVFELKHVWLSDEYAGADCDPRDNPSEAEFQFVAFLKGEEPGSPVVGYSGWRNGPVLQLEDGSDIEEGSLTLGWGATPAEAKENLIQELADRL